MDIWRACLVGAGRPEHGIYGTVLTAGLIAAQDPKVDPLGQIVVDVLITVAVFWLAHGYAHAVARPLGPDEVPGPPRRGLRLARSAMVENWPLARASVLPIAVLALVRLLGASMDDAQEAALWTCVVLLTLWGLRAGQAAGLAGWRLVRYTSGSALLGVVLVVLEIAIH
ncbi:hypothetical protein [Candidatus Frankia nodulisporulans]|uniref:hypothetical protein n=1 Tax=Candidatus Frankia nodulisporulans TaxID=2060052 RepID=UPI0013D80D1C|nr:hypothetical protein [Candidatus Frankia nodulisporulans]